MRTMLFIGALVALVVVSGGRSIAASESENSIQNSSSVWVRRETPATSKKLPSQDDETTISSFPSSKTPPQPASQEQHSHSFPESEIVLDMAALSHAVYRLRNKVQSCHDDQAKNKTVLEMLIREDQRDNDDMNTHNFMEEYGLQSSQGGSAPDTTTSLNDFRKEQHRQSFFMTQQQSQQQQLQYRRTLHQDNNEENDNNNDDEEIPQDIFQQVLPNGTKCLYYSHDYNLGRQVLIVQSTLHDYIAVAYAGTDDWRTVLSDGDILTTRFGPDFSQDENNSSNASKYDNNTLSNRSRKFNMSKIFEQVPDDVKVHRGFNNAVFKNDGFSTILDCILSARLGGNCSTKNHTIVQNNYNDNVNNDAGSEETYYQDTRESSSSQSLQSNSSFANTPSKTTKNYKLYTTGHSLGAADSMLLGAALHLIFPTEQIQSINFGCPKVGNLEWAAWMNQLQPDGGGGGDDDNYGNKKKDEKGEKILSTQSETTAKTIGGSGEARANVENENSGGYQVFRFVNKIDLIPRLPELLFQHAGHTLQMSVGGQIEAYHDHFGNDNLGYAGVPFGWGAAPYALLPMAIAAHPCSHYVNYLEYYRPGQNASSGMNGGGDDNDDGAFYFVDEFERVGDNDTAGGLDPP